jgi:iron complex outermembrane receptor protein
LGEEAFVPNVNTQTKAAYLYEELPIPVNENQTHKITFGARLGHTSVDSKDSYNFGSGKDKGFNPNSYALGGIYSLNQQWSLASNLPHNDRAPRYFVLFAIGEHWDGGSGPRRWRQRWSARCGPVRPEGTRRA